MKIWGQGNDLGSPWAILEKLAHGQSSNLACLHYQRDVHCLFPPVFIHFSTACHMQYAKSHIKKALYTHTHTHTHTHTRTKEPSADPGIDSKNSHLRWSSGFIQLHLPELFVWLCNVKFLFIVGTFHAVELFSKLFPQMHLAFTNSKKH